MFLLNLRDARVPDAPLWCAHLTAFQRGASKRELSSMEWMVPGGVDHRMIDQVDGDDGDQNGRMINQIG